MQAYVKQTFSIQTWQVQQGQVVPITKDLPLHNTARHFPLVTFLYADLDRSTSMVESLNWAQSAEIYKTYLYCASRLIRHHEGQIVSFDGDRVMGVFLGNSQSTNAVRCSLRINWAVIHVIRPAFQKQYLSQFTINHTVGIDASETHCCRTGVRGDNDLVWIGSAANAAAKLTSLSDAGPIWITDTIYDCVHQQVKVSSGGSDMWTQWNWPAMGNRRIHNSTWWKPL